MEIIFEGERYNLEFAHHLKGAKPGARATQARLEKEGVGCVADAYAVCGKGDQYSKFIGRKLALTRLLMPLPRTMRTAVWQQYWEETNKGYLNADKP